jgi:hypothetical protein
MGAIAMAKKTLGLESVADLEARQAAIRSSAADCYSKIERLTADRADAETWESRQAIDAEIAKQNFLVERLARDLQTVEADLAVAREKARQRRRDEILRGYEPALRELALAAASMRPAMEKVIAVREGLANAGFEREAREILVPPHVMGSPLVIPDFCEKIEAEIESFRANRVVRRIPATPAAALKLVQARPLPHEVRSHGDVRPGNGGSKAPLRPLLRQAQPKDPAMVLVRYLRPGVELPDGAQSLAGDQVAVPKALADALLKNGAVDKVLPGEELQPEGPEAAVRLIG